jgi:hypothetical protein
MSEWVDDALKVAGGIWLISLFAYFLSLVIKKTLK